MNIALLSTPMNIGSLQLPNRLIQGPLAGFSAAPFRKLFYDFIPPAYSVTEMISAQDVLTKHGLHSRYLYRAAEESRLCYQLAGSDAKMLSLAAKKLQLLGADIIDINCGCPKAKIRKKGAGSALMDNPELLYAMVSRVREQIEIPLTIKLRIHGSSLDVTQAQMLEKAGADALIIHGRKWTDNYDKPCDYHQINFIKQHVSIPVVANGDIDGHDSLQRALIESGADAFMISRAGCGRPWLYQNLLQKPNMTPPDWDTRLRYFMQHVQDLAQLESAYQAVMQSKSLIRYYFPHLSDTQTLKTFYTLTSIDEIAHYLHHSDFKWL